jgi:hypothetical protein
MHRQLAVLIVVAGAAMTVACGPTGAGMAASAPDPGVAAAVPTGAQAITVTVGNSLRFAPASLLVRAGQPVELTLRNGGSIPHDFALTEDVSQPVKVEAGARRRTRGRRGTVGLGGSRWKGGDEVVVMTGNGAPNAVFGPNGGRGWWGGA